MKEIYLRKIMVLIAFIMSISLSAQIVLIDEGFDGITSGLPNGWEVDADASGEEGYGTSISSGSPQNWNLYTGDSEHPKCLRLDVYNLKLGAVGILKTPVLDLGPLEQVLTFDWKFGTTDAAANFQVFISTDGGATYTAQLAGGLKGQDFWDEKEISLASYQDESNVRIVFVGVSDHGGYRLDIDNVKIESVPLCAKPEKLGVSLLTQTSANLNWELSGVGSIPSKYYLKVVNDVTGAVVIDNDSLVAAGLSVPITGLTPNTTYNVLLQSDCTGDQKGKSVWSESYQFSTVCDVVMLPFENNFSVGDAKIPACWHVGGGNAGSIELSGFYSSDKIGNKKSLKISSSAEKDAYFATPQVNHAANDMEISFKVFGSKNAQFVVALMSDVLDVSSAVPFYIDSLPVGYQWTEYVINTANLHDTSMGYHLVVQVPSGATNTYYFDEFKITELPTCVRPSGNLSITNVTNEEATLSWTSHEANIGNDFQIKLSKSDAPDRYLDVKDNPYTILNLESNTEYSVAVRQICAAGDTSAWSRSASFKTYCSPIEVTNASPFVEDFEGTFFPPNCWTTSIVKGTVDWRNYSASYYGNVPFDPYAGAKAVYFTTYQRGDRAILATPIFSIPSDASHEVRFWVYRQDLENYYKDVLKVWVNDQVDTVGAQKAGEIHRSYLFSPKEESQGWYQYVLPIKKSGDVFIMFDAEFRGGSSIRIDKVEVRERPTCLPVKKIYMDSISVNSARITWDLDLDADATEWLLEYKLTSDEEWISQSVADNRFIITGLTPNTEYSYDVKVTANCNAQGMSEKKEKTFEFSTPCMVNSFPYVERFENNFEALRFNCWTVLASGSPYYPCFSSAYITTEMHVVASSKIATPAIDIDTWVGKRISMDITGDWSPVRIGIMSDPMDETTFTEVASFNIVEEKTTYSVDLTSEYRGKYIGIMTEYSTSLSGTNINFDNVKVTNTPSCEYVDALQAIDITESGANLTIADEINTTWDIKYYPFPYNESDAVTMLGVTTKVNAITGLSPQTQYAVVVRSVCSPTDHGNWSDTLYFVTKCTPFEVTLETPFFEGFENSFENDAPVYECWEQADIRGGDKWKVKEDGEFFEYGNSRYIHTAYEGDWNAYLNYGNEDYLMHSLSLKAGKTYDFSCYAKRGEATGSKLNVSLSKQAVGEHSDIKIIDEEDIEAGAYQYFDGIFSVPADGVYYLRIGLDMDNKPFYTAIDNIEVRELTCLHTVLSDVQIMALTEDSVSATWIGSSRYIVKVGSEDFYPATDIADIFNDTVTTPTFNISGLSPNTTYYFYIKTLCDNGDSKWSRRGEFKTHCSAFALPFVENFDVNLSDLDCWIVYGDENAVAELNTTYKLSGNKSFKVHNTTLVSPTLDVSTLVGQQFSSKVYTTQDTVLISVGLAYNLSDILGSYVPIGEYILVGKDKWHDIVTVFNDLSDPEYSDWAMSKNILITVSEDFTVYLDDINIDLEQTCPKVMSPLVKNITYESADIDWTPIGRETTWELIVSEGDNVVYSQEVYSHPVTISGLATDTEYNFQVRAICSVSDTSEVVSSVFSTTCKSIYELPFSENFNDLQGDEMLNCWTTGIYDHSGSYWRAYEGAYSPTTCYEFDAYGNRNGHSLLNTPPINLTGVTSAILQFDLMFAGTAGSGVAGKFGLFISTDNGFTYSDTLIHAVYQKDGLTNFQLQEVDLTPYTGSTIVLGFKGMSGSAYPQGDSYIRIDNVNVFVPSSCKTPVAVKVSNITANTISVNVTDTAGATTWEYAVVAPEVDIERVTEVTTVSAKSFQITGLESRSEYALYVRAICGEERSRWTPATMFTTECDAKEIPYSYGFDDITSLADLECYEMLNLSADGIYPSAALVIVGNKSIRFLVKGDYFYFVLPQMNSSIDSLFMKFNYRVMSLADAGNIELGLMPMSMDMKDFVLLNKFDPATADTQAEYDFGTSEYKGRNYRIVIRQKCEGAPRYPNGLFIDDINITYRSSCDVPTSIELVSAESNTASFLIQDTVATAWVVAYGHPDTAIANYTTINISDVNVQLTGLKSSTTYNVLVAANCSGVRSNWTLPIEFLTSQKAAKVPYTFGGFEDAIENENWTMVSDGSVNNFVIGSDVLAVKDGNRALYVSNDGSNYNYDNTKVSKSWAYRTFNFEESIYDYSYFYNAGGLSTFDYLRVFVLPADIDPATLTSISATSYGNSKAISLDGSTELNSVPDWTEVNDVFTIDSAGSYNVVFYWRSSGGGGVQGPAAIDNFTVTRTTCIPIISPLTLYSAADTVSIDLNPSNDNAIAYQVILGDNAKKTFASDTICFGRLDALTEYTYRVRVICAAGDTSTWKTHKFTTTCEAVSLPYTNGFESGRDLFCTEYINYGAAGMYPYAESTESKYLNSGNRALKLVSSSDTTLYFVLPEMETTIDSLEMSFYYTNEGTTSSNGNIRIGLIPMSLAQEQYIELEEYELNSSTTKGIYYFANSGYTGADYRIAFAYKAGANDYSLVLDDVEVRKRPEVYPAEEVVLVDISNTTADFVIVDNLDNSQWQVSYGIANTDALTIEVVNKDSFDLASLLPGTEYKLVVNAKLGNKLSAPTDTIYFTTVCDAVAIDNDNFYTENFEAYSTGVIPDCWTVLKSSGIYPSVSNESDNSSLLMQTGSLAIALPKFTEPVNNLYMEFDAVYNGNIYDGGELIVGYTSNITDEAAIEDVITLTLTKEADQRYYVDLTVFPDTAEYIVLSTYYDNISIDSLIVEKAPDCYAPNALTVLSVSNSDAIISYNTASTQINAEYKIINVSTQAIVEQSTSNENPLNLTNLLEMTDYAVVIRSQCINNTTEWSDTLYFTTLQTPATVPYVNNWEDAEENTRWTIVGAGVNQWVLGADLDAQNGGATSLYISNGGDSYDYTLSRASSKSWAYRTFYLEAGVYSFTNDIKVDGEKSYDRMRPYLVPVSIALDTATETTSGVIADNGPNGSEMPSWSARTGDFIVETAGYYNLAIHWKNDASNGNNPPAAVDNLSLELYSCIPLYDIQVDSIFSSSVVVSINNLNDNYLGYECVLRTADTAALTEIEIANAVYVAADSMITINNLMHSSEYYLNVRTICALGDTSKWSETVQFATLCVADTIDENRMYIEGFENYGSGWTTVAECWTQNNIVGTSSWRTNVETSNNRLPRTGKMNMVLSNNNRNHMSREVYLFAGEEYAFEMWARQDNTNTMDATITLGIITEGGVFDTIAHKGLTDGDYQRVYGLYTPTSDGIYTFEMRGYVADNNSVSNYLAVDDIRFYINMCSAPEILSVSDISSNGATLTWVSAAENTNVQVLGAGIAIDTIIAITTDTMLFSIEDLAPFTSYTVQIANICGDFRSVDLEYTFSTPCAVEELPYSNNFESYSANELPSCWDNSEGTRNEGIPTQTYVWAVQEEQNATTTNHNMVMRFNSFNGGVGEYNILKSPQFNISDGNYTLSFDYKNISGGAFSSYISIDGGITYCDTLFENVENMDNWGSVALPMTAYEGELLTIVWHSVSNNGTGDAYHYIDNLKIACYGGVRDVYGVACEGQSYEGYGFNIPADAVVNDNSEIVFERIKKALIAQECDTTIRLHLTVNNNYNIIIEDSFCSGTVYSEGLFLNKTEGGTYMEVFTSSTGCDSTVTLILTEIETEFKINTVLCEGSSMVIGRETVTQAGVYRDSLVSTTTGCDSIIVYNVTVIPTIYESSATICGDDSYVWQGRTLVESGRYVDSLVSIAGCDSIIVLNLTVIPTNEVIDTTLCEGKSILFNGDYIDSTGVYTMTVQVEGTECMKTTTLNLMMASRDTIPVKAEVCEGEPYYGNGFSGVTITQDTVMYKLETGEDSCRYMTELHLALVETIEEAITVNIAEGETYTFDGNTYSESGTYVGEFEAESTGCDSIVTLTLNVGSVGVGTVEVQSLVLAPNPVDVLGESVVHRDWTIAEQEGMRLEVLDALGKVLYATTVREFPVTVNSIGVVGMYYVRITTGTGEVFIGKLIVK